MKLRNILFELHKFVFSAAKLSPGHIAELERGKVFGFMEALSSKVSFVFGDHWAGWHGQCATAGPGGTVDR